MHTKTGRSATFNRILVVDNQGVMGAGLETLLSGDAALEVWGVALAGEQALVQEIQRIEPDVIILIRESQEVSPGRLLDLLADYGRLRIISVSMNSNAIEVYNKQPVIPTNYVTLIDQLKSK